MFSTAIREKLVQRLRTPLREQRFRQVAEDILPMTRYRSTIPFIHALLAEGVVRKQILKARNGKTISLYSSHPLEEFGPYELAWAMYPRGYFCNLTAIFHHGLTDQVPNSVYVCHETLQVQHANPAGTPSESMVRSAFIQPHRHTNHVFDFRGPELVVLSRALNSDHGVVATRNQSPCPVGSRVAGLERALIDSVVAPQYNGGITSLPAYFTAARDKLQIDKLLEIYRKLKFVYPYAQSIGFLLELSGMSEQADRIRKVYPPRQRFFLDHNAKSSWIYNERWMIYSPKEFVDER